LSAINTDVLFVLGEEIQGRTGGALVLMFVFSAGLRTDALAGFNMAESRVMRRFWPTVLPPRSACRRGRPARTHGRGFQELSTHSG
jgi:hypothetical protein